MPTVRSERSVFVSKKGILQSLWDHRNINSKSKASVPGLNTQESNGGVNRSRMKRTSTKSKKGAFDPG